MATLASVVLNVRQLFNTVEANKALLENKKTLLAKAEYDYQNRLHLVDSLAISNEDFIHAKDNYLVAQLDLKQAEAQYHVSLDAIGNLHAKVEHHPLVLQQKEAIRTAYYYLKHCSIYAPATGYVAQRSVEAGEWITPSTPLMSVIPTDYVWVDANFKETQLSNMRVGQPATIWFDYYGSKVKYNGKVIGIASGSGSVFSLIPPQNATGNWIKIVQRLPVRISLDPQVVRKFPVRLGISAEVDVDICNTMLPMLPTIPPKKAVSTTSVFTINFEEIEQMMEKVIQENLKDDQQFRQKNKYETRNGVKEGSPGKGSREGATHTCVKKDLTRIAEGWLP